MERETGLRKDYCMGKMAMESRRVNKREGDRGCKKKCKDHRAEMNMCQSERRRIDLPNFPEKSIIAEVTRSSHYFMRKYWFWEQRMYHMGHYNIPECMWLNTKQYMICKQFKLYFLFIYYLNLWPFDLFRFYIDSCGS